MVGGAEVIPHRAGRRLGYVAILAGVAGDVVIALVDGKARAVFPGFVVEGRIPRVLGEAFERHRHGGGAPERFRRRIHVGVVADEPEVRERPGQELEGLLVRKLEALQRGAVDVGGGAVGPDEARVEEPGLGRVDGRDRRIVLLAQRLAGARRGNEALGVLVEDGGGQNALIGKVPLGAEVEGVRLQGLQLGITARHREVHIGVGLGRREAREVGASHGAARTGAKDHIRGGIEGQIHRGQQVVVGVRLGVRKGCAQVAGGLGLGVDEAKADIRPEAAAGHLRLQVEVDVGARGLFEDRPGLDAGATRGDVGAEAERWDGLRHIQNQEVEGGGVAEVSRVDVIEDPGQGVDISRIERGAIALGARHLAVVVDPAEVHDVRAAVDEPLQIHARGVVRPVYAEPAELLVIHDDVVPRIGDVDVVLDGRHVRIAREVVGEVGSRPRLDVDAEDLSHVVRLGLAGHPGQDQVIAEVEARIECELVEGGGVVGLTGFCP